MPNPVLETVSLRRSRRSRSQPFQKTQLEGLTEVGDVNVG